MRKFGPHGPMIRVCAVAGATIALLYAIAVLSARDIDVERLAPSTPRKSIELNKRNNGIIHSGPGEPALGKTYRAGAYER